MVPLLCQCKKICREQFEADINQLLFKLSGTSYKCLSLHFFLPPQYPWHIYFQYIVCYRILGDIFIIFIIYSLKYIVFYPSVNVYLFLPPFQPGPDFFAYAFICITSTFCLCAIIIVHSNFHLLISRNYFYLI